MSEWQPFPSVAPLTAGDVHLVRLELDLPPGRLGQVYATLSPDERLRAGRFLRARDRCRFVAGRGQLRQLLGRCLGTPPRELRFAYGEAGKPELRDHARVAPRFNVSHSAGLGLVALGIDREIGVDVELVRPGVWTRRLVESVFTPAEVSSVPEGPPAMRAAELFARWTRKEAYLKAVGTGLVADLAAVGIAPGWQVEDAVPRARFCAAVAASGSRCRIRRWQWPATDEGRGR